MESAARFGEYQQGIVETDWGFFFDRGDNDRWIPDGDDVFGRIRLRVLSAGSSTLTDYGHRTQWINRLGCFHSLGFLGASRERVVFCRTVEAAISRSLHFAVVVKI